MKRKIMAVSMVKNEADIIESFVRYCCGFLDGVIVLDNRSTDDTLPILRQLASEGLPVFIVEDTEPGFFQAKKTSRLVQLAIDNHQADLILPLDADEFPTTASGSCALRDILETLSLELLHYVRWRIYIPHTTDDLSDPCIPRRIRHARPVSLRDLCKVIVPAQIWREWNLQVTSGNHDAASRRDSRMIMPSSICGDLSLAHFPVRSLDQIKGKAFVGRINHLAQYNRTQGESSHMMRMFTDLKNNRIQPDKISCYAKEYISSYKVMEEFKPITWPALEKMELLYTSGKDGTWLRYGLENMENLARESRRIAKNEPPAQFVGTNMERVGQKASERLNDLRRMQSSYSWRLTYPLRLFVRLGRALAKIRD